MDINQYTQSQQVIQATQALALISHIVIEHTLGNCIGSIGFLCDIYLFSSQSIAKDIVLKSLNNF